MIQKVIKGSVVGTLLWEGESGEGNVILPDEFEQMSAVARCDAIHDWISVLTNEIESIQDGYEIRVNSP